MYRICGLMSLFDYTCLRIDSIRNHCIGAIEKWGKCNNREKRGISLFLFHVFFTFFSRFIHVFFTFFFTFFKNLCDMKKNGNRTFYQSYTWKKMLLSKLAAKIIRIEIFYINLFSLFILLASTCCSISFQFLLSSLILHS